MKSNASSSTVTQSTRLLIKARNDTLGTAQRNIAAPLLTTGSNFDDPSIVSVIVVTSLSMFVVIRLIARQSVAGIEQPEFS